jgi:hypothetical protein
VVLDSHGHEEDALRFELVDGARGPSPHGEDALRGLETGDAVEEFLRRLQDFDPSRLELRDFVFRPPGRDQNTVDFDPALERRLDELPTFEQKSRIPAPAPGEPPEELDERVLRTFEDCHLSLENTRGGSLSCHKSMSHDILKKLKEEIKTLEEELHIELPRALKWPRARRPRGSASTPRSAGYINARSDARRLAVDGELRPHSQGKVSFGSVTSTTTRRKKR